MLVTCPVIYSYLTKKYEKLFQFSTMFIVGCVYLMLVNVCCETLLADDWQLSYCCGRKLVIKSIT